MKDPEKFNLDFVGVGAPRSGTTWLSAAMSEHPDICFPAAKELDYFNSSHFDWVKDWRPKHESLGLGWYRDNFRHYRPGQIRGEYSVVYLYDEKAPRLIRESYPGIKVVICLRDPVEAVYSRHMYHVYDAALPDLREQIRDRSLTVKYGFYSPHIRKYLRIFPPENVLIIFYDDIREKPAEVIGDLYGFLGVDRGFVPACLYRTINAAGGKQAIEARSYFGARNYARKILRDRIAKYPRAKRALVGLDLAVEKLLLRTGRRKKKYRNIPHDLRRELREIFREETKELEKITGRDLSSWLE